MLVQKTLKFDAVSLKMKEETGTFSGYASVFGNVDRHGDTIKKGAFLDTIQKSTPKMFFNHNWGLPIGKWVDISEDDHGLFVKGEFTPELDLSKNIKAAMKHGTLDGLSIGGFLKKGDFEETKEGRLIHKWSELAEISPVCFPADNSARINLASVKSVDFEAVLPECKTERDIERLLRDAGLGKWEAMALVSRAKNIFAGGMPPQDAEAKTMAALTKRIEALVKASATA